MIDLQPDLQISPISVEGRANEGLVQLFGEFGTFGRSSGIWNTERGVADGLER